MSPELSPELFQEIREAEPDAARVAAIQKSLARSTQQVRPLASNAKLRAMLLIAFTVLTILGTLPFGFGGFRALSVRDKLGVYGAVLVSASVLAVAITERMIPGARRRVPVTAAVLIPVVTIGAVVLLLFPATNQAQFVRQGIPCLRLGVLLAIPSGALLSWFTRRGFVTEPFLAAISGGAFSGLAGVAVLALHCPIQNAAHIVTWHLGVIAVSAMGGGALGWMASRLR